MKSNAKICVIVPAYNVRDYIERCIESLLAQDIQVPYEVRIIDDGSTDGTSEIIKKYAINYPEVIKYMRKENGGQSSARNLGIQASDSDYIGFVDSDDYVDKSFLSSLYQICISHQVDIAMCGINRVPADDGEGKRFHSGFQTDFISEDIEWILCHSSFAAWNKLYRRELFKGLTFPEGITYEDFALIPQVMFRAKRIAYTHTVLYHYFLNENSTIMSKSKERKTDRNIIVAQRILEKSELSNNLNILENLYIRRVIISMAWSLLEYCESIEEVKKLVTEGKTKYPHLNSNIYIKELPTLKRLFVRLLLNDNYFLAGKVVSWNSSMKKVYAEVRTKK